MPFGGFKDFAECERKVKASSKGKYTDEQVKRICGAIKKREEGEITDRMLIELFEREGYIKKIELGIEKSTLSNGIMELDIVPLTEGIFNRTFYSHDELKKAYKALEGMVITTDHSKDIKAIVGRFGTPKYENGIKVNAFIDDPKIVDLLKRGYDKDIGISMELYGHRLRNSKTKMMEMTDINFVRGSLVLDPACPRNVCTIHPMSRESPYHTEELAKQILSLFDLVSEVDQSGELTFSELITKCEKRYMTGDGKRFKKGFEGCLEAMAACRGFDKKHGEAMCNYFFHRRGGKGQPRKKSEQIKEIIELFDAYEAANDKDKFIEDLVKQTGVKNMTDENDGSQLSEEEIKKLQEKCGEGEVYDVKAGKCVKKEEKDEEKKSSEKKVEELEKEIEKLDKIVEDLENCKGEEKLAEALKSKTDEVEKLLKSIKELKTEKRESIVSDIKKLNKEFDTDTVKDWSDVQLTTLRDEMKTLTKTSKRHSFPTVPQKKERDSDVGKLRFGVKEE